MGRPAQGRAGDMCVCVYEGETERERERGVGEGPQSARSAQVELH